MAQTLDEKYNRKLLKMLMRSKKMQTIYNRVIEPYMNERPEHINVKDWIDYYIFRTHERYIKSFKVLETFKIPGLYWYKQEKYIPGYGPRQVVKGSIVYVRYDRKEPKVVDVEAKVAQGTVMHVYRMTLIEWQQIKNNYLMTYHDWVKRNNENK